MSLKRLTSPYPKLIVMNMLLSSIAGRIYPLHFITIKKLVNPSLVLRNQLTFEQALGMEICFILLLESFQAK